MLVRTRLRSGSCLLVTALLVAAPLAAGCQKQAPAGMVYVPAGEFVMGTDEKDEAERALEFGITKPWFEDEHPAHTLDLAGYFIDLREVTHADYFTFVQATGRPAPGDWNGGQLPPGREALPVVHVSWHDAKAYCAWAGKRLPAEAEWEKAARGTDGRLYPWGNAFDAKRANVNSERGEPKPVGSYPEGKSPFGALDMIGNVWEWTEDWYKPYPGNSYQHARFGEQVKVLRGNSWANLGHYPPDAYDEVRAHYSRVTFRLFMSPNGLVNDVGFRCAASPA